MNPTEGDHVECIHLDDPYTNIPTGTTGVVTCVDDTGTIHVHWDNGAHLGLIPGQDRYRVLDDPRRVGQEQT